MCLLALLRPGPSREPMAWPAACICLVKAGGSVVQAPAADMRASRSYANKNLTDNIALSELLKEVQALRQVVQDRQAAMRPKLEQVTQFLQEDLRTPVIEMLQEAAGDAERASRELIDAGGDGGTACHSEATASMLVMCGNF